MLVQPIFPLLLVSASELPVLIGKHDPCQLWPSRDRAFSRSLGGCIQKWCTSKDTWGQGWWGKGSLWNRKSKKGAWWELVQVLQEGWSSTSVYREAKWWVSTGHRFQYNKLIFGEYQMIHPEGKWYCWWEEMRICQINETIHYIDWTFSVPGSVKWFLHQCKHFDVYTCKEVSSTNSP